MRVEEIPMDYFKQHRFYVVEHLRRKGLDKDIKAKVENDTLVVWKIRRYIICA